MDEIIKVLLPGIPPAILILLLLLLVPEKIEKWSALLWKMLGHFGGMFRSAHKRYVRHDLQGRVNDFVRTLKGRVPGLSETRLRIEWVDDSSTRKSFIDQGQVVLRLRRADPEDTNFVHGAYLFTSTVLLSKAKRYLAPTQKEAVDLFVCTKILQHEKPAVLGTFLDTYLHPRTDEPKSRIALYVDDFAMLDSGGYFFPVFIQELEYLGSKVFGRRRDNQIIGEVNDLISFLKPIATRQVGDINELNFNGAYCRFGIVIVGKPSKLLTSIQPYVGYIRKVLIPARVETLYVLARLENKSRIDEICRALDSAFVCSHRVSFARTLRYRLGKVNALQYLVILRSRTVEVIHASHETSALEPERPIE